MSLPPLQYEDWLSELVLDLSSRSQHSFLAAHGTKAVRGLSCRQKIGAAVASGYS